MNDNARAQERNGEIVTFFYKLFGNRIHSGMSPEEARKDAYDAVTLRYGIGRGRLLNIISDLKNSRKVNDNAFRQNALTLVDELKTVNGELTKTIRRNEQLITLLEECIDDR